MIQGLYLPVQSKANNGDCSARWMNYGILLIGLNDFFNHPFDYDITYWLKWASFAVTLLSHSLSIYAIVANCSAQLKISKATLWHEDFNMLEDTDRPIVGQSAAIEEPDDEDLGYFVGKDGITYYEEEYVWYWELLSVFFLGVTCVQIWQSYNS